MRHRDGGSVWKEREREGERERGREGERERVDEGLGGGGVGKVERGSYSCL